MGYDIFATGVIVQPDGTRHRFPNYQKSDRDWGDEWQMDKMVDTGLSFRGANTGGTVAGGLTVDLASQSGNWQLRRQIAQTLAFLAISSEGEMSIFAESRPIMGINMGKNVELRFKRRTMESTYRKMLQFMEEAQLNKMGPMIDLIYCLNEWAVAGKRGYYYFIISFKW